MSGEPIDDGGPAFPLRVEFPTTGPHHELGMTLRDYFAGQVLSAVYHEEERLFWKAHFAGESYPFDSGTIAESAYRVADAMLAERKRGAEGA